MSGPRSEGPRPDTRRPGLYDRTARRAFLFAFPTNGDARGAMLRILPVCDILSSRRGPQLEGTALMSFARRNIAGMSGYVPGEQPRERQYTKLNTNENPYPPSPKVAEVLRDFDPARLRLYSDPLSRDVRRVAASHYGLSAEWVVCGNGSDDLLTIALRTFVDQGATVAYPVPSYSLYPILADLQGAVSIPIELTEDFGLPEDAAVRAAGAPLFLLARPNAPTGNAFPMAAVRRLCGEFEGVVWIDEAYVDFAADHCVDLVRSCGNVVVSRTLSKSYSLAGIRLGFAFANPDLIGEMMKVKDSYNVNALTQALAKAALEDRSHMLRNAERIRSSRERVTRDLAALGFEVLPSQANFILAKPPTSADRLFRQLKDSGFLVRYFNQPRIEQYIRITIGTDDEMEAFTATVAHLLA